MRMVIKMPTYKVEGELEAYLCRMSKLLSSELGRKVSKTEVLHIILFLASKDEDKDTGPSEAVSLYSVEIKNRS